MKFCKDCKHCRIDAPYQKGDPSAFDIKFHTCAHPELLNPVDGCQMFCHVHRSEDGGCAPLGKHFEPKEGK